MYKITCFANYFLDYRKNIFENHTIFQSMHGLRSCEIHDGRGTPEAVAMSYKVNCKVM